jgi:hypothetical protein
MISNTSVEEIPMDIGSMIVNRGVKEVDHLSFQQLVSSTDKLVVVEFYMDG